MTTMRATDDSTSSQGSLDSLSARSYFDQTSEVSGKQETPYIPENTIPDGSISATPGDQEITLPAPGRRLRERRGAARANTHSEKTENHGPQSQERPVRKRGRPRLQTAKDAAAIEERRLQIRRAQRTYRQKKETTIQALKTRVDELEQTLQNVADLLESTDSHAVAFPAAAVPDRLAQARRLVLAEIHKARSDDESSHSQPVETSSDSLRDIFGYNVSSTSWGFEKSLNTPPNHPRSPSPLLNRLFPSNTIYTYSNQESDLSRRLHRFCLEHIYRWLSEPYANPSVMTRVFGLVPCIQDMPGIRRSIRRSLQSEIGGTLERVNGMPYYCLGGAGTHYPRYGQDGMPLYPVHSRRPDKILRRLVRILRRGGIQDWDEDWSGDAEPDAGEGLETAEKLIDREDRIRALGLEGDWFDCHDVQGYLAQQGLFLNGSSVWIDVPPVLAESISASSSHQLASQVYYPSDVTSSSTTPSLNMSSSTFSGSSMMGGWQNLSRSSYVLDVECFFDQLLANVRFLGRAPGFRLLDVDVALRGAIQKCPVDQASD